MIFNQNKNSTPFIRDILWFISIESHVVCVPAMTTKCILLHNHKKRIVIEATHNLLMFFNVFLVRERLRGATNDLLCSIPLYWTWGTKSPPLPIFRLGHFILNIARPSSACTEQEDDTL